MYVYLLHTCISIPEDNIHQDMTKCRDAVRDKNWPLLGMLTQGIAAKAKRVAEVGKMAAEQAQEPWKKNAIIVAVTRLENCNYFYSITFLYIN